MSGNNHINMLDIPSISIITGQQTSIHPTLIWDDDAVILIDTGYPGQLPLFMKAIEGTGNSLSRLNTIIVTHHDLDHIGGLVDLRAETSGRIRILAHEIEKPYINGEKRPLKLAQMGENQPEFSQEKKAFYDKFKAGFQKSFIEVDITLKDGEVLPECGGIMVVHTPGHTLGHICLLHQPGKILVAGDLLRVESGKLTLTPDSLNYDNNLYKESLKKLTELDISSVICYHGGFFDDNPNQRIAELARQA